MHLFVENYLILLPYKSFLIYIKLILVFFQPFANF